MIRTYRMANQACVFDEGDEALQVCPIAAWIDLYEPTASEEEEVEGVPGVDIPTREEMSAIEASSRIYMEGAAAVMTIPLLLKSASDYPQTTDGYRCHGHIHGIATDLHQTQGLVINRLG